MTTIKIPVDAINTPLAHIIRERLLELPKQDASKYERRRFAAVNDLETVTIFSHNMPSSDEFAEMLVRMIRLTVPEENPLETIHRMIDILNEESGE